ncbi:MAG: 50S ribosomal protein L18 [Deltaproteobacteria bacterium]|nr:50S ribosomal protein L18 [Deltaproteobacteria bacterium]MBW2400441.1 50S ribosomal protein L18 [Deltaproteobacteria bacterium]MBW2665739.1 50S ribosomal protein L18 [Deltaproteobacteria bacterium]
MKRKFRSEKERLNNARRVRTTRAIAGTDRTRLTVFRSAKHIYAQLVDPASGRTLASVSSRSKQIAGDGAVSGKVEMAKLVGKAIAEAAREKEIGEVVFNRNGFLYHGRVKALAEAAREAGLQF